MQWLGAGLGLFKEFNLTRTHKLNGQFHFSSAQVYICRNLGDPLIMVFPEVSISRYIFPVGRFAQLPFFGKGDRNLFSSIIFLQGIELPKIKFHRIFESNNHLFQGILVFGNLVVQSSVWIKNVITQCMGLMNKYLLADLMMMILSWNKTNDDCSTLICVQTSI